MTDQLELPVAEVRNPLATVPVPMGKDETSRAAARRQKEQPGKVTGDALTVLGLVVRAGSGGRTCFEVEQLSGLLHQTAAARLWGLEKQGFVHRPKEGPRRARGPGGVRAKAYLATPAGVQALAEVYALERVRAGWGQK